MICARYSTCHKSQRYRVYMRVSPHKIQHIHVSNMETTLCMYM